MPRRIRSHHQHGTPQTTEKGSKMNNQRSIDDPLPGMRYRRGGFEFLVDFILNGEVYLRRRALTASNAHMSLMRIELKYWRAQMADTEPEYDPPEKT
jgi:hypothetical protein